MYILEEIMDFYLFLNFSKIESSLIKVIIDILDPTSELELNRVKDNANW